MNQIEEQKREIEELKQSQLESLQNAEKEAEKIKTSITDDTLNKLAKYVHKVLGLSNLNCNYDINKEKCRCCSKRKPGKINE